MASKFEYNQEALKNLQIEDPSILDRLIDGESARQAHLKKERGKVDKRMSLKEAVQEFVKDGDIYADSGFSYVRTPLQALFEVMRQGKKNLQGIGSPNTNHSYGIHYGTFKYSHNSYLGAEMRGTDRSYSKAVKEKKVKILSEWSHGAMALGFKAAQLGAPYLACKSMIASDMVKYNPYVKVVDNPFKKEKDPVCLVPALYPDVVFIHVQWADKYGNARIYGPAVNDIALAAACRKVIITAEEIVPESDLRNTTNTNVIPFMFVDAVVHLPYGALPGNCPGYYYWSREFWEWGIRIALSGKDDKYLESFWDYWVFSCKDQFDFLEKLGGVRWLNKHQVIERALNGTNEDDGIDLSYESVIPKWDEE
ncbi:glutaconate CoA-transferase subunit A [Thermosyntropha lipolytica DSM 11003]|uniref:Glutaconate CoA-transferase subunit A n=1 Tax=Thermosyntropha lipolytica DSM 11003 TaxID=1123382 RepID=A0A1M5RSR1_9FIRM|nr:CoA-transferase [Thermosyntropha lipolytica]SHH29324.1 glutaconate CoA-transferase subunit A [Thermosyntropha lipolytica DSM 11003]